MLILINAVVVTKWLVFCFWWRAPFFRPAFPALCRNQYSEDKALELKGLVGEGEWIDGEELANWTHLDKTGSPPDME